MDNIGYFIYTNRALDILILLLLLIASKKGVWLLFMQTVILTILQNLDAKNFFQTVFQEVNENSLGFFREIGVIAAFLVFL